LARGALAAEEALARDYRATGGVVNVSDYMMGVLGQFHEDAVVMNPMNISLHADPIDQSSAAYHDAAADTDTGAILRDLADKLAARGPIVDFANPIGHSAIEDTRVFIDTSVQSQASGGYPSGEIPAQFVEFNGISAPDRIVKIIASPFNFPHVYTPTSTIFDVFYARSVFMTIRFVPATHLVQSAQPNELFTFELAVDDIESSAVFLRPLEPVFCLRQPVTITGDLTIRFQVRAPSGGFIACPIPPTQISVARVAAPAGGPTTFSLSQGMYIGVLAPPGAAWDVPILFRRASPASAPLTPLEAALVDLVGRNASNFTALGTFTIPDDTSAIAGAPAISVFIPKNSIAMALRFSSLQATRTNDLFPIHQ
jgi:hypothetical protein